MRHCRLACTLVLVLVARTATSLVPLGTEFQVNTNPPGGYDIRSSVARDAVGNFVVVWESPYGSGADYARSIQGQRFDASGAPLGGEFLVNAYTTDYQVTPVVAMGATGGFVVVWNSYGGVGTDADWSIQGQRFDAAGAPVGAQFQVNSYTQYGQYSPAVAMTPGGDFVVAWDSNSGSGTDDYYSVQAQRFDATGAPAGAQFQVNSYTTYWQERPGVAIGPLGNFVIAWSSYGSSGTDTSFESVQAQRFDTTGAPVGSEFQVNTYTTSVQEFTKGIAMDAAGNFVITWDSNGSAGTDTTGCSVQARRFDASGTPLGSEFQVNTYTTGPQGDQFTTVAMDAAGNFLVAWDQPTDIEARYYDSAGIPAGGEFHVNTETAFDQELASVAASPAGDFVAVWRGFEQGNDIAIKGQRFGAPGTEIVPLKLILINKPATASQKLVLVAKRDPGIGFAAGDPSAFGAKLTIFETSDPTNAAVFRLPPGLGTSPSWTVDKEKVAKYVNKDAPAGPTGVKVSTLKPGLLLKAVAANLGDGGSIDIDRFGLADESLLGNIGIIYEVGGSRMCAEFDSTMAKHIRVAAGTGQKYVAKSAAAVVPPGSFGCLPP